jgi:hypothetical protein
MSKTEKIRKSPSESATKFSVGTIKKGNDGNMWKIIATAAGVHRWGKIQGGLDASKHNKTVKNSKNTTPVTTTAQPDNDNISLDELKKLAKKYRVLSSGKSKGQLALLIFDIRGQAMSTTDLEQITFLLPANKKRIAKKMIATQIEKPVTDYKGMWKPLPKPLRNMSRKEMIHNLRKFRDAWETNMGRNQDLSDERLADESETELREHLEYYYSNIAKNQAANYIRDNL